MYSRLEVGFSLLILSGSLAELVCSGGGNTLAWRTDFSATEATIFVDARDPNVKWLWKVSCSKTGSKTDSDHAVASSALGTQQPNASTFSQWIDDVVTNVAHGGYRKMEADSLMPVWHGKPSRNIVFIIMDAQTRVRDDILNAMSARGWTFVLNWTEGDDTFAVQSVSSIMDKQTLTMQTYCEEHYTEQIGINKTTCADTFSTQNLDCLAITSPEVVCPFSSSLRLLCASTCNTCDGDLDEWNPLQASSPASTLAQSAYLVLDMQVVSDYKVYHNPCAVSVASLIPSDDALTPSNLKMWTAVDKKLEELSGAFHANVYIIGGFSFPETASKMLRLDRYLAASGWENVCVQGAASTSRCSRQPGAEWCHKASDSNAMWRPYFDAAVLSPSTPTLSTSAPTPSAPRDYIQGANIAVLDLRPENEKDWKPTCGLSLPTAADGFDNSAAAWEEFMSWAGFPGPNVTPLQIILICTKHETDTHNGKGVVTNNRCADAQHTLQSIGYNEARLDVMSPSVSTIRQQNIWDNDAIIEDARRKFSNTMQESGIDVICNCRLGLSNCVGTMDILPGAGGTQRLQTTMPGSISTARSTVAVPTGRTINAVDTTTTSRIALTTSSTNARTATTATTSTATTSQPAHHRNAASLSRDMLIMCGAGLSVGLIIGCAVLCCQRTHRQRLGRRREQRYVLLETEESGTEDDRRTDTDNDDVYEDTDEELDLLDLMVQDDHDVNAGSRRALVLHAPMPFAGGRRPPQRTIDQAVL